VLNVLKIEHQVKNRLLALDLKKDQISAIAKRAIGQKLNATSNHPVNAPGTLAYLEGVRAMRDTIIDGVNWVKLVENGMEYIENSNQKIRLLYQNVDHACNLHHDPQPITKRAGSAKCKAVSSNQVDIFGFESTTPNVWILCVSENKGKVNAEVSMPSEIMANGSFSRFIERIFVLQNYDLETGQSDVDYGGSSNDEQQYDDDIKISFKG